MSANTIQLRSMARFASRLSRSRPMLAKSAPPRVLGSLATTFAVGAAILLSATGTGLAQKKPQLIKLAAFTPPREQITKHILPEFARRVTRDSGGTIRVEVYPGGVLGKDPRAQYKLVLNGVLDMALIVPSNTPGRFLDDEIVALPLLVRSSSEGAELLWRLYAKGKIGGYEKVEVLSFVSTAPYSVHTRFPVKSLKDLAGKRVRSGTRLHGLTVQALGASPVAMSALFVAENLAKGVIDGTLFGWESMRAFRVIDAAYHHVEGVPLGGLTVAVIMNKRLYKSLSTPARAAINKHRGLWFSTAQGKLIDGVAVKMLAAIKADKKHTVVKPTGKDLAAWQRATAPVLEKWKKERPGNPALLEAAVKELKAMRSGK